MNDDDDTAAMFVMKWREFRFLFTHSMNGNFTLILLTLSTGFAKFKSLKEKC